MNRPPFTLLRALGILVGLLLLATAPLIAKDEDLWSLDGSGHVLVSVAMGLIFIGYGLSGISNLSKLPPKCRWAVHGFIVVILLAYGAFLLKSPSRTTASQIVGAVLFILGVISVLAAYARRRSAPSAQQTVEAVRKR